MEVVLPRITGGEAKKSVKRGAGHPSLTRIMHLLSSSWRRSEVNASLIAPAFHAGVMDEQAPSAEAKAQPTIGD